MHVIDTFPAFTAYRDEFTSRPLDDQIEAWSTQYMASWPDLLAAQIEDYASQKLDWRQIAREKVFPFLDERLPAMRRACQNLLDLGVPVCAKAQLVLAFDSEMAFVIYVGIGCGAGWATTFRNLPSVLFGLENIAESGWSEPAAITGLMAHEIGHLAHQVWRARRGKPISAGPWWQLYEEGFAQYCESLILGTNAWHQTIGGNDDDWFSWCQSHKGGLAVEFLRMADAGLPVNPFFGSWFDICGKSETGYFLGCEAMRELAITLTLNEMALLENAEHHLRPILEHWILPQGRFHHEG